MLTWKKALLVNVSMLAGFVLMAFVVPGQTPAWVFLFACALVAICFNVALFRKRDATGQTPKQRHLLSPPLVLVYILFSLMLLSRFFDWPIKF
jgi:hypothetical protein